MNRKTRLARKGAMMLWAAMLGVLIAGGSTSLSAQTAEGVTITNIATATYTDANGNAYTAASGQVSVTVGFQGSLDVTSAALVSPASPSTGNPVTWTITNNGNGSDQVLIALTNSDPAVVSNVSFFYNGNPYANLAALNLALGQVADSIAGAGSITIDVIYDVPASQGGNTSNVELTATSTRTGGDNNSSVTAVQPQLVGTVEVVASNSTIDRLPSNGTALYTESFTVTSSLTGTATLDMGASLSANAANLLITRIREGPAGAWVAGPTMSLSFTPGQITPIEVEYRVDGTPPDAGSTGTLTLTATATAVAGTPNDADNHVVTIIAPLLSVVKTVHGFEVDAQGNTASTLVGDPQPGTTIWYRVQVTNNGTAPAVITGGANGISDDFSTLPVTYVGGSLNETGSPIAWTGLAELVGVITGTIAGGLPGGGGTAWFVFAVTID